MDEQAVADKRDIVVQASTEDAQVLRDQTCKCECGQEITISAGDILNEQLGSEKKKINCPKCGKAVQR